MIRHEHERFVVRHDAFDTFVNVDADKSCRFETKDLDALIAALITARAHRDYTFKAGDVVSALDGRKYTLFEKCKNSKGCWRVINEEGETLPEPCALPEHHMALVQAAVREVRLDRVVTAAEFDRDPRKVYEASKLAPVTVLDSKGRPSMTVVGGSDDSWPEDAVSIKEILRVLVALSPADLGWNVEQLVVMAKAFAHVRQGALEECLQLFDFYEHSTGEVSNPRYDFLPGCVHAIRGLLGATRYRCLGCGYYRGEVDPEGSCEGGESVSHSFVEVDGRGMALP